MALVETVLVGASAFVLILLVAILVVVTRRRPATDDGRLAELAQTLTELKSRTEPLGQVYKDVETLKERTDQLPGKMERLDLHTKVLPEAAKSLKGVETRVEPFGKFVSDTIADLGILKTKLEPISRQMPDAATKIASIIEKLSKLPAIEHKLDQLHGVFVSTTGRGQIGEAGVRRALEGFPDDAWKEKLDLPAGQVDFAVRTPNGMLVPVDSKTGGSETIAQFLDVIDRREGARALNDEKAIEAVQKEYDVVRKAINDKIRKSAREIEKYIDPQAHTTPFVLEAVPDAVFDALEPGVRQDCSERGVIVVPYGLLHPMATAIRRLESHGEIDPRRLAASILKVRESSSRIREAVKNSVERAATMATNAAQAIRDELNAIDAALITAEAITAAPEDPPELSVPR